jgi:bacterioferritin-associated ferredoxin
MVRCECAGIGERRLRRIVRSGAGTAAAVGEVCGAGTWCGACLEDLAELVAEEVRTSRESRPSRWRIRPPAAG